MLLLYDKSDLSTAKKLHDDRLKWLQELGAAELASVGPEDSGFLFGYAQGGDHLLQQVGKLPNVHDQADERDELLRLDAILERMDQNGIAITHLPVRWADGPVSAWITKMSASMHRISSSPWWKGIKIIPGWAATICGMN